MPSRCHRCMTAATTARNGSLARRRATRIKAYFRCRQCVAQPRCCRAARTRTPQTRLTEKSEKKFRSDSRVRARPAAPHTVQRSDAHTLGARAHQADRRRARLDRHLSKRRVEAFCRHLARRQNTAPHIHTHAAGAHERFAPTTSTSTKKKSQRWRSLL